MVGEAALDQLDHDGNGRRRSGRGPQQCSDGSVRRTDNLGSELEFSAFVTVFLDDLHSLSCIFQDPVLELGVGDELAQRCESVFWRLADLIDEVFGEWEVMQTGGQHGEDVIELQ